MQQAEFRLTGMEHYVITPDDMKMEVLCCAVLCSPPFFMCFAAFLQLLASAQACIQAERGQVGLANVRQQR